jgi:hypothetical protein
MPKMNRGIAEIRTSLFLPPAYDLQAFAFFNVFVDHATIA